MKQYFIEDEQFENKPKVIKYNYDGEDLIFNTNSGMFSRDEIDSYSEKLVSEIEKKYYNSILDLGCGYGFIGIYLSKKVPYQEMFFIDITQRACDYTLINCKENKVSNYNIIKSDGINIDNKFDLITLNPPIHAGKEVVYRLYQDAINHLSDHGEFYIVIHKKHGAKSTLDFLEEIASSVEIVSKKKALYILKMTR